MVKRRLGFQGCESYRKEGGLALLWKKSDEVEIFNFFQNHISAWVNGNMGENIWLFTDFYREPETSRRMRTWNLLKNLRPNISLPWMVIGDFNEILYHCEKVGG